MVGGVVNELCREYMVGLFPLLSLSSRLFFSLLNHTFTCHHSVVCVYANIRIYVMHLYVHVLICKSLSKAIPEKLNLTPLKLRDMKTKKGNTYIRS